MESGTQNARPLIAVVEDDVPTVDLLREILKDEGYEAIPCLTAEDAFRTIRKKKPDLIILDLHLNGGDSGLKLIEILRTTPLSIETPIIVSSADAQLLSQKEHELRAFKCDILPKPFDLEELLQKVTNNISSSLRAKEQ